MTATMYVQPFDSIEEKESDPCVDVQRLCNDATVDMAAPLLVSGLQAIRN
jgi:hypothetical protein